MNLIDGFDEPVYINQVDIPIFQTIAPNWNNFVGHFRIIESIQNTYCDGEIVGNIASCAGGGIEIEIKVGKKKGCVYFIKLPDIWRAVCKSLELTEEDLIGEEE